MRKILKVDELPEGFFYFTDTHIVEGTGKKFDEKVMKQHEGVHSEKRNQMVVHCGYRKGSVDGQTETKNTIGF